ncbi:general secretion pathway protein GspB [Marinimicrobium sp. C2-29]|uniref:general secretion pathway protein GspB n=1 Tax=Marinimicrobium sp. C2-29 TaxID=3139825 RepID=UPI0031393891
MILDALKRADRERRQQEADPPSLVTEHAAPPHARPSHRRNWLLAGALLLAGAAIGLTLASVKSSPESDPDLSSETVPDQARLGQGSSTSENSETSPSASDTENPAPTPDNAAEQTEPDLTPSAIARLYQKDRTPGEAPEPAVAQLYQAPQPAETPAEEKEHQPPEPEPEPQTVSVAPPRPSEPVRLAEEPLVPGIRDLPWSLQQDIPSINYQAHNYREGGNSSVTINQRKRRAGDEVAQGVRIERIESDGLVLIYEGKTFKLKAMNSWVNM